MGSELYTDRPIRKNTALKDSEKVLYDYEAGYRFWLFHLITDTTDNITQFGEKDIKMLICDEQGNSKFPITTGGIDENLYNKEKSYGTIGSYTKITNRLKNEFGESQVKFFPYDWRLGIKPSAISLNNYLEKYNFDEINIIAHSMGGLVACEYVRISNCKEKIKLITLGTPFLGAPKTFHVLETGMAFSDGAAGLYNYTFLSQTFKEIIPNLQGVYDLFPTKTYFDINNQTYINKITKNLLAQTEKALNYNETCSYITSKKWCNGFLYNRADKAHKELNILEILNEINSFSIVGYGKNTLTYITEEENIFGEIKYISDKSENISPTGDGTVPLSSSTIGGKIKDEKLYYINEEHSELVKNKKILDVITDKLKNWNILINDDKTQHKI